MRLNAIITKNEGKKRGGEARRLYEWKTRQWFSSTKTNKNVNLEVA